ncbi:hypothetical protein D3C76_902940 [compost metagenome]
MTDVGEGGDQGQQECSPPEPLPGAVRGGTQGNHGDRGQGEDKIESPGKLHPLQGGQQAPEGLAHGQHHQEGGDADRPPAQQLGVARLTGGGPGDEQQGQGQQALPRQVAAKAPVPPARRQTVEEVAPKVEHAAAHQLHGDGPLIRQGGQQQGRRHAEPQPLGPQGYPAGRQGAGSPGEPEGTHADQPHHQQQAGQVGEGQQRQPQDQQGQALAQAAMGEILAKQDQRRPGEGPELRQGEAGIEIHGQVIGQDQVEQADRQGPARGRGGAQPQIGERAGEQQRQGGAAEQGVDGLLGGGTGAGKEGADIVGERGIEEEGGAAKAAIHGHQPAGIELPLPQLAGKVVAGEQVVEQIVPLSASLQPDRQHQERTGQRQNQGHQCPLLASLHASSPCHAHAQ